MEEQTHLAVGLYVSDQMIETM